MANKNDVILSMNQEAQDRKKRGIKVINGSIGMMYLDDGALPVSSSIRSLLAAHVKDEDLIYPSVSGSKDYQLAVRKWFLSSSFDEEANSGHYLSLATMGGTGAVTLAFAYAKEKDALILLPSLGWPNYEGIAKGFQDEIAYYDPFDGMAFNIKGIAALIQKELLNHAHLALLINDPCQNPTGYSLTPEEWREVVALLSKEGVKGKVDLIVDAAYIDYGDALYREEMKKSLKTLPNETLLFFCFSFSKTLSFYGLRIGALAVYGKDKDAVEKAYGASVSRARALWSVPNHMAMNAVSELLLDEKRFKELKDEVSANKAIVSSRAEIFLEESAKEGLSHYPYRSGFFITLPLKDAFESSRLLMEKNIFLAPVKPTALRIALCSLKKEEIVGLAHEIKKVSVQ
jgi:aromatic-amino-acid transaminase